MSVPLSTTTLAIPLGPFTLIVSRAGLPPPALATRYAW